MRTRYIIDDPSVYSRKTAKHVLLRRLTELFLPVTLLVVLSGCATNYPAPYRFTESSTEKRHDTIKPERTQDHNQQEFDRSRHDGVTDSSVVKEPGFANQSMPEHPAPTCAVQPMLLPPKSATLCASTPFRNSTIGQFLEGKIENALMVVIPLVIHHPWLRLKLMLAAPYVEDAILDLGDWLMAEPLPQI